MTLTQYSSIRIQTSKNGTQLKEYANRHTLIYLVKGKITVTQQRETTIINKRQMTFIPKQEYWEMSVESDAKLLIFDWEEFEYVDYKPNKKSIGRKKIIHVSSDYKTLTIKDELSFFFVGIEMMAGLSLDTAELQQLKCKELFFILRATIESKKFDEVFYRNFTRKQMSFKQMVWKYAPQVKTLSQLIAIIGISRAHFHREFNALFGMPPYKWMLKQKAENVKEYLINTKKPIKAVAQELGFGTQANLNKFCSKYLGMTAKKIQKEGSRWEDVV